MTLSGDDGKFDSYLDKQKLDSFLSDTTISGIYLKAWNAFQTYANENKIALNLDSYLVTFASNENEIMIYFTKPRTKLILGGGNGTARVSKDKFEVINVKFSK